MKINAINFYLILWWNDKLKQAKKKNSDIQRMALNCQSLYNKDEF